MNVLRVAQRHTLLRVCSALLVILILPALAAARQPRITTQGGNNPPRAIIGPNQKIGVHPNVLAVPTLDGTKSFDPDFDVITYKWKDSSGMVIGTGPTVQVILAFPGTYTYSLTVCDTQNACNSASTTVEVVIDVRAPVVDAPDITVSVTDPGGATVSKSTPLSNYVLSGATTSAVDDVDPQPQFLRVIANNLQVTSSTFFPEGDTPLSVFYTDQAGNIGMSPATMHVVDRQDDDIFILTGEANCFFSCPDLIQRVRGGVDEGFCQLAGGSSPIRGIITDSSGRVVALRAAVNIAGSSGLEMVRCSVRGAPPEKFAFFQGHGGLPAGYPEPFPALRVHLGDGGGGLTLARLREVVIDDNQNSGQPFIVNEDAYIFNLQIPAVTQLSTNKSVMYHVKQDFWEDGPDLGSLASAGAPASMFFNSGTTYVSGAGTGCLRRDKIPLSIHATGNVSGVSFNLRLNLFSSSGEFCGLILNDVTVPDLALCPGIPPPNPAPTDGNAFAVMTGFTQVFFDDLHGHGLTLISNSGATVNGILTNFSQEPLDNPSDPSNFFGNPFIGCALSEEVRYTPLYHGVYLGGPIAVAPRGLIAMFGNSNFFAGSSLDEVTSSGQLTPIVSGGLGSVSFVTAWPPNVSAGAAISVLIRIDSPVDVLVTDPNGKKLGMQNGAPVNDFGNDGSDTGAGSHPRFYAINKPAPGEYKVDSVGTGTGPYTVHIYSVDTSKPFGQHILSSGNAAPGALSNQNFTFGAGASIAFTNHAPTAIAGPDQTVNAAANGTATVNLDGSASNDPDGDSLTFTWAGPFGLVNGTQPQVTLPVGVNVLALTVDDGKGGTASANVTITVNPPADTTPPVVTPPANISIPATEAGGARGNASPALAAFLAGGTAVDNVDPSPARLSPQVGGVNVDNTTLFALGVTTPVTFSFSDASGNVGMANASVTVVLGTPRISAAVIGKGLDASGARYVDLQLTNTGTGNARNVKLNQLPLRTLSGSGTVSYNTTLSPALPISIGSLDLGGPKTVRLFFNVPATVTRYSLTESGTLQDVAATNFSFSASQSVIP